MMKKQLFAFAVAILLISSCGNKQPHPDNTVRLRGQLIDMGSQHINMSYNGAASYIGGTRDFTIITDEQGLFDTTFVITEPGYYNISRNTLYLSPGDNMEVKITQSNAEGEFSGKGAEMNNYMKYRLFPKGGSFLEAGRNIVGDFTATRIHIDSLSNLRFTQLDTLNNATEEFKQLEAARIKADIVNSYLSFMSYAGYAIKSKGLDFEAPASIDEHLEVVKQYANPLIKEFSDEKYLDVAVVRNIMSYSTNDKYASALFNGVAVPERTKELFAAYKEADKLLSEVTPEIAEEVATYAKGMVNRDFAVEVDKKVELASKLFAGKPAIDFELDDVDGNTMRLSDFKGKVLYIDLWATWCGPCIQEAPYFEKLSKEYVDKDIMFIPISTDKGKKVWLEYLSNNESSLTQYQTVDPNLQEGWSLKFIPRFLLIDKDFNIVNAYALRPSDDNIKDVLDGLLN